MMTESFTKTIRGNVESPYDYPLLSAEFAFSSIEGATTLTDVETVMAAGVNISRAEVRPSQEDRCRRVEYVPVDLHKSMLDEDIVKYALERKALIVTRD